MGGVSIFFLSPDGAKQLPLPQGRGFVAKRVFARSNKRGGRADKFSHPFSSKNSGQKKRIVGSEISHFRAMISLLFVYLLEKKF